jgi:hypothetical protein
VNLDAPVEKGKMIAWIGREHRWVAGLVFAVCSASWTCMAQQASTEPAETTVGRYEIFELELTTTEAFDNPFTEVRLTAEFISPDGRKLVVAGFYYGDATWMVRLVPDQAGQWSYQAKLTGKSATTNRSGTFRCVPSKRQGFVRISKRNPYRLEFDDATPFYPIGVQTCGYFRTGFDGPNEDGSWRLVSAETWSKAFEGATNLVRWQLGTGTKTGCALPLIPVGGPADRYDTDLARKMDELLRLQKAHGFSHIMVLFQDMSLWGKADTSFGRVDDLSGYKSIKAANLPLQEAYLRYVVARFGSFVDIWELFNEDSYAPNDYLSRLAAVVRQADPHNHPITTNYARPAEDWCEIVTWHAYMRLPAERVDAWVAARVGKYKSYGKPVLNTEFGNKGWLSNFDPIKWRIAVWTAYMNESNILFWGMSGDKTKPRRPRGNSNAYLGPDSRRYFRALNDFTRDLPIDMHPVDCSYSQHDDIRIYALSNRKTSALYLHRFADHSQPYVSDRKIYVHTGPGRFQLTWINPADGDVVKTETRDATQQYLFFEVPPFTIDLACRLDRED